MRTPRGNEDGTALVEFALALPILAMLAMGTVDLGRVYQTYTAVKNSARAAAAYAQYHPGSVTCADPGNIPWQAQHESTNTGSFAVTVVDVTTNTVQNACDTTTSFGGDQIKVTVTKPAFQLLTPLISAVVGTLNVRSSITVRAQ